MYRLRHLFNFISYHLVDQNFGLGRSPLRIQAHFLLESQKFLNGAQWTVGFVCAVDVTKSLRGAEVVIKASGVAGTDPSEQAPAPAGTGPRRLPAVPGSWGAWKLGIRGFRAGAIYWKIQKHIKIFQYFNN